MAFFQYRAADHAGKIVEGVMEAEAERGVVARLHEMGCVPLRIYAPGERAAGAGSAHRPLFARRRVGQRELLQFTHELGTLLAAGMPLDRSLSILRGLAEGGELGKVIGALLEAVRAGKSLASSMSEHPDVFPRLYVNMIRAGEAGGMLEGALRYLSDYLERSTALKEDIKSALIYPVMLASAAGLSLIVLFVYVVPRFALIFKDVRQTVPWITRAVIGVSQLLADYGWLALLVAVAAAAGLAWYWRTPAGRLEWDRLSLRLWLIGDLVRKFETSRFARTLSALLKGGVPLLEALGTVQGVVGNRLLARAIGQVQVRVREGKGMARTLAESGLFPQLALNMIGVGEETGKLEGMLVEIADYYDQEVKRATKRLTSLLEPVLILGMGLVIGIVVISMLLAIFSINDLPF
ncbi:MAG TPA: type II secretion system F family protein [candidate division Zixibacteria bacterium]|nr:type II secretion system F family protein [candidate division Zixibacteria bacterium]